jgi:hypothetical protein
MMIDNDGMMLQRCGSLKMVQIAHGVMACHGAVETDQIRQSVIESSSACSHRKR